MNSNNWMISEATGQIFFMGFGLALKSGCLFWLADMLGGCTLMGDLDVWGNWGRGLLGGTVNQKRNRT
ncbi:hypothetical protein BDV41DRAFT_523877 [Aspergillus transmontanensis]|uniref:Uncharacterized protein n=1 Tax=Aspergillus transmontanensis TaxID=1034304 RepID=A0A5N6WBH5_9EURO|nr:hypothetical protein BDV41DRAFT_523877 [Aspergillus transmontanensis]